jgi:beta-lactamase regulating signal transducer with metallopeptidase domain/thiol-disulfide isomerase/thioredoxin/protocatechuate 3,4-dioxygenase beta subunit
MNSLQAITDSPMVYRLGWILLHSVWEALAVAIGLAVLLPALRRRGARAGYAISCGALLLTVLLPALTFLFVPAPAMPQPALADVAVSRIADISVGTAATPRSMPVIMRWMPDQSLLRSIERPAPPSTTDGSPPAASTVELSWKERAVSLGRQFQARAAWLLPWIVLGWSLGVALVSLWNIGGWFAVQRLKTHGTDAVTGTIQDAAARIARQLGLKRRVRLLRSALVDTPLVIGALKPVILLPAALITELPAEQLEALLAHELAHVLRQDYIINLLQSVVETLLFYHPAVWWISSQVRKERENCCDDLAVNVICDRTVYVRALATVAGARASSLAPAATGGLLAARLRRILGIADRQGAQSSRWLTGAAILSLCVFAIAFTSLGSRLATAQTNGLEPPAKKNSPMKTQDSAKPAKPPAPAAKPGRTIDHPEFPTKGSMRIRVTDTAGHPLPYAGILVSVWTNQQKTFRATQRYTCDEEGLVTVELPKSLWILRLWAAKKSYCKEFYNFETNARVHELVIPDEFTFRMVKGTTLAGTVTNEEGRPIAGATVECSYAGQGVNPDPTVTDAHGRWKLDNLRPESVMNVRATHPDYLGHDHGREPDSWHKVTTQASHTGMPPLVLRRGIRATVKVTDPAGKPVKGAVVLWGNDQYFRSTPDVVTDANGFGQLPAHSAGPVQVTVVAKGWMPDSRKIEIGPKMSPIGFHLRPGKKLRIRFVDGSGAPVPKVFAPIDSWRKVLHLTYTPHGGGDLDIPRTADKNGVFQWDWAPDDPISFLFMQQGFEQTGQTVTADGQEHVVTIKPLFRLTGTVRDAGTGRNIDSFLVAPILYFQPDNPFLDRTRAQKQTMGHFGMQFERTDVEHGIQIEATGYKTFRTDKRYRLGDANADLDVRLQPARRYVGTVVDPAGHPVKGAHVSVASALEQLDQDGLTEAVRDGDFTNRVDTDRAGAFEIASQLDRYALVAVSPDGFAEVEREASQMPGEIRLARWAKLTGRLLQYGKPVPTCNVFLTPLRRMGNNAPRNSLRWTAKTSEDGLFEFKYVPPIACRVNAQLHWGWPSPLTSSESAPLWLKPGETAHTTLGGPGSEVTGRLVAENQPPGFDYHFGINYLVARRPGIAPPAWFAEKSFDWKKGWSDAWRNTPEGGAYLNTLHHWFVKPEPDGHFRISGLPPGEYDFAVNLYGPTESCLTDPLAAGVVHFSVSDRDARLDLGKLSIPSLSTPKIGETAGDFSFDTLAAGKSSLVALRGNYVLIDFWATWCTQCVRKLDAVEQLREQFAGDKPLVVLGVNLDANPLRVREFLKSKPLPWQHALLGDWSSTDVPRRFAVSGVPAYVLIDPNGRILARVNSLDEIASKLKSINQPQHEPLKKRT